MKKSRYFIGFLGYILLWVGIAFLIATLAIKAGILEISPRSTANPLAVFPVAAVIFILFWILSCFYTRVKEKKRKEILEHGTLTNGYITDIKMAYYAKYNRKSPYIVHFMYKVNEDLVSGKSDFIWELPEIKKGDAIDVYILGKDSAINL